LIIIDLIAIRDYREPLLETKPNKYEVGVTIPARFSTPAWHSLNMPGQHVMLL
jgi:hypothetical protein